MSKFKNSFEQFKKDPNKWRQDSWDKTSNKQTKLLNILMKSTYGCLAALSFLLGFGVDKKYFIVGIIALIILIVFDTIRLKDKSYLRSLFHTFNYYKLNIDVNLFSK